MFMSEWNPPTEIELLPFLYFPLALILTVNLANNRQNVHTVLKTQILIRALFITDVCAKCTNKLHHSWHMLLHKTNLALHNSTVTFFLKCNPAREQNIFYLPSSMTEVAKPICLNFKKAF